MPKCINHPNNPITLFLATWGQWRQAVNLTGHITSDLLLELDRTDTGPKTEAYLVQ